MLDLGVSSYQIDEEERGFSYIKESPLDMRMDKSQKLTAKDVVNSYDQEKLANLIYEYGEEKFSRQIARKIVEQRKIQEITTTTQLVEIIKSVVPNYEGKTGGHPAKRAFQAIRIEVNDELRPLYDTVQNSIKALKKGGRLCIITFHSLEDRIVKNAYIDAAGKCICPPDLPYCKCGAKSLGKIITKKPIIPSEQELENNSRSQSAKLRIFENPNGTFTVNMAQIDEQINELDNEEITKGEISQRLQIQKIVEFMRENIPGLENAELFATASDLGIRESRRIVGKTLFCLDDIQQAKKFDDRIAVCANSIDMHQKDRVSYTAHTGKNYYIPLSCLISNSVDNLLTAGKSLSADKYAFAAVRVMPPCIAMGEAAGITAALAAQKSVASGDVPHEEVQKILIDNGAFLG